MSGVTGATLRLAALWREIEGIRTAFDTIPRVIQPAQCPAVIIFPGEATYDLSTQGEQAVRDDRIYRMVLFYAPAAFGTATQQQTNLTPFLDTVRDFFVGRPGLALAGQPRNVIGTSQTQGDSGYQVIDYATGEKEAQEFAGSEFRIRIQLWVPVTYYD